jgi:predicted porin
MKGLGMTAASVAVVLLCGAGGAYAADLPTKAPAYKAPADNTCTSIQDFFTTSCQLSAYGVRFYGTIDAGFGYQTNSAKFDKLANVNYFPAKNSLGGRWLPEFNALSASNIGLQIKEPLWAGWSFVGQVESSFLPDSLQLLNGAHSVYTAVNTPLIRETAIGDSSTQGKFYNNLGFAGFSNDTWGTLTFGRQNSMGQDLYLTYDPMGVAAGFSVPGFFGGFAGGGDTQDRRDTTAIKYRVSIANWHFGAYGQVGGYGEGNGSKGAIQGDVGADFKVGPGVFSADVEAGYRKSAVALGLSGASDISGVGVPNGTQTMTATISNNTNVIVGTKYTLDRLKLYAGYEWIQFANPSDVYAPGTGFTDIAGDFVCAGCQAVNFTNISTTSFSHGDKIQQLAWVGGRYALTDSLDVVSAYYHVWQNDFSGGGAVKNSSGVITSNACSVVSTAQASCAGSLDAASILLDWKFAPKWDTYIGTVYSRLNGGMDSGFLAKDNWATTAGLRFRW